MTNVEETELMKDEFTGKVDLKQVVERGGGCGGGCVGRIHTLRLEGVQGRMVKDGH